MQTLNTFFNTQQESLEWAKGITKSQEFIQAKQCIAEDLAGFQIPPSFYELLILKLCEALDIEIGDILVWGWRKPREIVQYRNKKNPTSGSHMVPLLEHTLVSKHSPTFQPVIDEVPLPIKLKFDITLKLKMKGAMLAIRDGKIMEVKTGTCTGSGSIEYTGFTIIEQKTALFSLPGSITFKQGIPI